ncbi:MAG: hypothetical protein PVH61_24025 [Candidatus Aminicenantes bacterium]|jgi:hypothetical protein
MEQILFNPDRIDLPGHLVMIPQFWDKDYYETLKKNALGCLNLLHSDLLLFENYTVIVGFLGYPHILTLLEFVKDIREKEVAFLGTAGSLNETINHPMPLQVEEIFSTEILEHFSPEKSLPLKPVNPGNLRKAKGVTVDIIQRETPSWLQKQVSRGIDFVEMELFPLRVYLEKPFRAIVVTTDLLKESGIEVFPDKKRLQEEFVQAYELIVKTMVSEK